MNCPESIRIAELVDGRLSAVEVADVEAHLDACSRCADLVAVAVSTQRSVTAAAPGQSPAIPAGARLGRYEIRGWLGQGGMGDVYEGFDPELERRVAIKVLRDFGDDAAAGRRRLAREARTLARLSSPRVVAALDIGSVGDRVFLVMELVEGPTLAEWLRAAPRTWRQILDAFLDAGEGLAAAHEVGIIHRDFKPQNVLMGGDGRARVSDFGLARPEETSGGAASLATEAGPSAGTGTMGGTPRYMSPEQFLRLPTDARTDQFSFCVALHEALYGRHPFLPVGGFEPADWVDKLRAAVLVGRPVEPRRNAGTARALAPVLRRGLSRNPDDRFPSLRDLLAGVTTVTPIRYRPPSLPFGQSCDSTTTSE
ncbi:MAG: protein kinase [Pseudomonadota bacterium]